MVVFIIFNFCL